MQKSTGRACPGKCHPIPLGGIGSETNRGIRAGRAGARARLPQGLRRYAGILLDRKDPNLARQNPADYIEGFTQSVRGAVMRTTLGLSSATARSITSPRVLRSRLSETCPFSRTATSETPVMVDFWAPWCGYCKKATPIVDQASSTFFGEMRVYKLNIDSQTTTASQFGVGAVPAFIFFNNGRTLEKKTGYMSKESLFAQIRQHLKNANN